MEFSQYTYFHGAASDKEGKLILDYKNNIWSCGINGYVWVTLSWVLSYQDKHNSCTMWDNPQLNKAVGHCQSVFYNWNAKLHMQ